MQYPYRMNNGQSSRGGRRHSCDFRDVISVDNLLKAWQEFKRGKRLKRDVAEFELNLEDNLLDLHKRLASGTWEPDPYQVFFVRDPKLRRIHKASVRDRVLYQAVYRTLYHIFDPGFIHHSFSSRNGKGTHAGVDSFELYVKTVSKNFTRGCYVLKCDIQKFFDSIDQNILFGLIQKKIEDVNLLKLIHKILCSFSTTADKGLPLGNVTSQLFANIYMNELDQYIKRKLKSKHYARYCDDFAVVSESKEDLEKSVGKIQQFCRNRLHLNLHPRKVIIRMIHQGVDFLGYVILPHYRVLRTHTKVRILKKLGYLNSLATLGKGDAKYVQDSVQSYLGILTHCSGQKIAEQIERIFWD